MHALTTFQVCLDHLPADVHLGTDSLDEFKSCLAKEFARAMSIATEKNLLFCVCENCSEVLERNVFARAYHAFAPSSRGMAPAHRKWFVMSTFYNKDRHQWKDGGKSPPYKSPHELRGLFEKYLQGEVNNSLQPVVVGE